jgi:hypothetical protein
MWGRVVEMVDDPDRDVRDAALQMLREFMKYGGFEYSAGPFLPSPFTSRHRGIKFYGFMAKTYRNAAAHKSGHSLCCIGTFDGITGPR